MLGAPTFFRSRHRGTAPLIKSLRHRITATFFQLKFSCHRGTAPLNFSTNAPPLKEQNSRHQKIVQLSLLFNKILVHYCFITINAINIKCTCLMLEAVSCIMSHVSPLLSQVSCLTFSVSLLLSHLGGLRKFSFREFRNIFNFVVREISLEFAKNKIEIFAISRNTISKFGQIFCYFA